MSIGFISETRIVFTLELVLVVIILTLIFIVVFIVILTVVFILMIHHRIIRHPILPLDIVNIRFKLIRVILYILPGIILTIKHQDRVILEIH